MSTKDPYTNRLNTRKAIRYHKTDKSPGGNLYSSFYASMFLEDLRFGITPFGERSKNPEFAVKIEPPSKEMEEIVRLALPTLHWEPHDITEAVCDFIEEAAQILAYYGKAYYEIVYFYADENKLKIDGFRLEPIPNYCMKETFGFYWQYLPKKMAKPDEENIKRFNWLPKNDLFVLSIPRQLGGIRKFKRLLSELRWLSNCIIPKFTMDDMAMGQQTKGYDFSLYQANQEIFLAKMTRHLGWPSRGKFARESLEFYQIYRYLKFEKTTAILREHILHRLNDCLKRVGKKMDCNVKIKLEGIPSSKDYESYLIKLIEGSLSFSEVYKILG